MTLLEMLLLGFALSMDCFAVSLSLGISKKPRWQDVLRMAFFFGLFQGIMPLIGWLIGITFKSMIQSVDHWLAFGILTFIGIRMIIESFRMEKNQKTIQVGKLSVILGLALATSIDALASGIGFGFIHINIFKVVLIISIITFLVTVTGARLGIRSRLIPARWAEIVGGVILILIGLKILLTHLGYL
jgi:manganese efflux pump family protein